jgi:hypothetical protein
MTLIYQLLERKVFGNALSLLKVPCLALGFNKGLFSYTVFFCGQGNE